MFHACGYPGHFVCADRCLFRLHHRVGRYRVSTVGDFYPGDKRKPLGAGEDSFFETMVFGLSSTEECGTVDSWSELEGRRYATAEDAEAGHYLFCLKYEEK
jgi:hypothetical protein